MESRTELDQATLDGLRRLSIALRDSQVGLSEAAANVSDQAVVELLHRLASERAEIEYELSSSLYASSEKPPEATSWMGELHTAWTRIRAAIHAGDATVVLKEVERTEAILLSQYHELLPKIAGSPLNRELLDQFAKLQAGYDALCKLSADRSGRQPPEEKSPRD